MQWRASRSPKEKGRGTILSKAVHCGLTEFPAFWLRQVLQHSFDFVRFDAIARVDWQSGNPCLFVA